MTRKDKLSVASKMLDDKATSPLDALTPDEIAYLETRGLKHNGHQYVISTFVKDNDTTERKRISDVLAKLPKETYLHIIYHSKTASGACH